VSLRSWTLLACVALSACGGARPEDSIRWREGWELLGALEDGSALDVRVSVSNTGLLRGQGHLRLERWYPQEGPVITSLDAPPPVVHLDADRRGLALGRDSLRAQPDGSWRFELVGADVGATVTLRPEQRATPPVITMAGGGQWASEAVIPAGVLTGLLESGKQGGLLHGRGVLLHRGGDARLSGERDAAFILGSDLALGYDVQGGSRLVWAWADGVALSVNDARLEQQPDGTALLDLRPGADLWVRLHPRATGGDIDPYAHLMFFERPLVRLLETPEPRALHRALAEVHRGQTSQDLPALLLHAGS